MFKAFIDGQLECVREAWYATVVTLLSSYDHVGRIIGYQRDDCLNVKLLLYLSEMMCNILPSMSLTDCSRSQNDVVELPGFSPAASGILWEFWYESKPLC